MTQLIMATMGMSPRAPPRCTRGEASLLQKKTNFVRDYVLTKSRLFMICILAVVVFGSRQKATACLRGLVSEEPGDGHFLRRQNSKHTKTQHI